MATVTVPSCNTCIDYTLILQQIGAIACSIKGCVCPDRVVGAANMVLADDTGFNLVGNDYRTVKISNTGANQATVNAKPLETGEVVEFSFPDHVDTPALSIIGSAAPNEVRVDYTNYSVTA